MCIFHDSQQWSGPETTVGEDIHSDIPSYLVRKPVAIEGEKFRAQEQKTKLGSSERRMGYGR